MILTFTVTIQFHSEGVNKLLRQNKSIIWRSKKKIIISAYTTSKTVYIENKTVSKLWEK